MNLGITSIQPGNVLLMPHYLTTFSGEGSFDRSED